MPESLPQKPPKSPKYRLYAYLGSDSPGTRFFCRMNACSPCVTGMFTDCRVSGDAISQNREQARRDPRRDAKWTSATCPDPIAICDHSTPNHASLGHQIRVRYLTDSEGEQPNCLWKSRRPSQLILTCGFAAKNWGSTRAKPDWLLTFAIPLFMRLKSGEKKKPGRRNAYRAQS